MSQGPYGAEWDRQCLAFSRNLYSLRLSNALFPRSEAKGKYVLFRSQQRRLRLVLLQQRGNSSAICRALSRQLHIWIDQQRGNMLVFSLCSR